MRENSSPSSFTWTISDKVGFPSAGKKGKEQDGKRFDKIAIRRLSHSSASWKNAHDSSRSPDAPLVSQVNE